MSNPPKKITADHALLDVKVGRQALYRRLGKTPMGENPNAEKRVPVTITGWIIGAWGYDDEISREFEIDVTGVAIGDGAAKP